MKVFWRTHQRKCMRMRSRYFEIAFRPEPKSWMRVAVGRMGEQVVDGIGRDQRGNQLLFIQTPLKLNAGAPPLPNAMRACRADALQLGTD